jgi:Putative addiction module component
VDQGCPFLFGGRLWEGAGGVNGAYLTQRERMVDDRSMSKAARHLLDEFEALPESDQRVVAAEILRIVGAGPFSDLDALDGLTEEQQAEIDRRLAEHDRDPGSAIPWDEGRARLFHRFA